MKVVIFKSGLAVSVPKNANISGTILVMKIPKLGLCRERSGLSRHIKSRSTLVDQKCGNIELSSKVH